jgi:selenoprotein W-related protein
MNSGKQQEKDPAGNPEQFTITIEYCPKCGWMLRAAYMAQELLTTFTGDIKGVLLAPSAVNGRYTISINDTVVFDRKRENGFPEIKNLKQRIRDIVNPGKPLGHSDKATGV